MKTNNCIYDREINVKFIERKAVGDGREYEGPRQINCPLEKRIDCSKCGWNPAVEEKRKKMSIESVHGHIDAEGKVVNRKKEYRGLVIKKEKP